MIGGTKLFLTKENIMNRTAVYALSADPITFGHCNFVERVSKLFDHLYVVIASNASKTSLLTDEEKEYTAKEVLKHIPNVSVHVCKNKYVAHYAQELGAQILVRGLRNLKDFDDEATLAEENRHIVPNMETLWVSSLPVFAHVSSSVVKSHLGAGIGWKVEVARLVPPSVLEVLVKKQTLNSAKKHWQQLMQELGNPVGNEKVFNGLVVRYSEPHRKYHILSHIVSMLDEFEEVRSLSVNPVSARLGIWYHDVIYDTHESHAHIASNEERSAFLAEQDLENLGVLTSVIEEVMRLISLTDHSSFVSDIDAQIVLDLDLGVIGQDDEVFDEYESNIRKEYSWVPEDIFKRERSKILKKIMERDYIYYLDCMRNKYELIARKNLKRSLEKLS